MPNTAEIQIQLRRGAASAWTSADPTLLAAELGFETDTGYFKIGDGSTAWTSLSYDWAFGGDVSVAGSILGATIDADLNTITNIGLAEFDTDTGDLFSLYNGAALDQPDVSVTSDGVTVDLTLEASGGGDVRVVFSTGVHTVDCTPIAEVQLTAGTDASPAHNYVYIPISTKVLTVSTSNWPSTEHVPIATVVCQSAASVQTDGVYKLHAWTDHVEDSDNQGHMSHLNFWIRQQPATWRSGVALTPAVGVDTFDISTTSGLVLQLHEHTMPAFDTSTGSTVYLINDPTTAYLAAADLTTTYASQDINGTTLGSGAGSVYNLVIWGVISQDSGDCQLYCNLPDGTYANNSSDQATLDVDGTAIYSIPSVYAGTGFLIARLTVSKSGSTYTILQNTDLRGLFPSVGAGGGGGGGGDVFKVGTPVDNQLGVWTGDGTLEGEENLTYDGSSLTIAANLHIESAQDVDGYIAIREHNGTSQTQRLRIENDASLDRARFVHYDTDGSTILSEMFMDDGDITFEIGGQPAVSWNETAGSWSFFSGVGSKSLAFNVTSSQVVNFQDNVFVAGTLTVGANTGTPGQFQVYDSTDGTIFRTYLSNAGDLVVNTTASPDMLQLIDAGATDETNASAYQEWAWSTAIGGAANRMGYFGFTSASSTDIVLKNEAANGAFIVSTIGGNVAQFGETQVFTTYGNNILNNGTFTSRGIDDNAVSQMLELGTNLAQWGESASSFAHTHVGNTQYVAYSGGQTESNGGNILMYGASHASRAGDMRIRSGANPFIDWDESAGSVTFSTGVGAKTDAMSINSIQEIVLEGDLVGVFASGITLRSFGSGDRVLTCLPNDGPSLYYNNVEKIDINSDGIDIKDDINLGANDVRFGDYSARINGQTTGTEQIGLIVDDTSIFTCYADRARANEELELGGPLVTDVKTLADSATPSVANGRLYVTGGTTTITNFGNGQTGQEIIILSEHAITISDNANIILNGSTDFVMASSDSLHLIRKADGKWYEIGRSVN